MHTILLSGGGDRCLAHIPRMLESTFKLSILPSLIYIIGGLQSGQKLNINTDSILIVGRSKKRQFRNRCECILDFAT